MYVSFYFMSFVIFETFILMNVFVAILNESITNSLSILELQQGDLDFINFAYQRLLDLYITVLQKSVDVGIHLYHNARNEKQGSDSREGESSHAYEIHHRYERFRSKEY